MGQNSELFVFQVQRTSFTRGLCHGFHGSSSDSKGLVTEVFHFVQSHPLPERGLTLKRLWL